jgi:hypothetical protein
MTCNGVRMCSKRLTAGVVTGENSLVLSDSVDIGLDDTSQESVVEVGQIVGITVAARCNPGIHTSASHCK